MESAKREFYRLRSYLSVIGAALKGKKLEGLQTNSSKSNNSKLLRKYLKTRLLGCLRYGKQRSHLLSTT